MFLVCQKDSLMIHRSGRRLGRCTGINNGTLRACHLPSLSVRELLQIVGLLALLSATAGAQISPGPLARAHKELEGATRCTTCHKLGGEPVFKCLDCHTEIASRLSAHKGVHFSYGIPAGSSQECAKCHSDHNGLDFPLIKWDPKTFDHKQTGYALEGKHAGVECKKCHTPEHIPAAERALIRVKDLNRTFIGVAQTCATCHNDPHSGRLGPNCAQCHNFTAWKGVPGTFDHSKTRYPLTGQHTQVKCEECHTPGPLLGKHQTVACGACHANGDFKKPLAFAKCTDCHKDAHNGQFLKRVDIGECSSCHDIDGWKPSKFDLKAHSSTQYPLEGKHSKLECAQCHIAKGKETIYKIKFASCLDCHHDEHQTQFAAAPWRNQCEQCHSVRGFKPTSFSLAKHKQTRFQLTGSHLAVLCSDCHKPASAFSRAALLPALVAVQATPPPTSPRYGTTAVYHFQDFSCTTCHQDPHRSQLSERMKALRADGKPMGCEACHSTKNWKDLSHFDHAKTKFDLAGAHRAVACIDCREVRCLPQNHPCNKWQGSSFLQADPEGMRGLPRCDCSGELVSRV